MGVPVVWCTGAARKRLKVDKRQHILEFRRRKKVKEKGRGRDWKEERRPNRRNSRMQWSRPGLCTRNWLEI